MKELTFHRWYLPWIERWPDELGYADVGGSCSTYAEHTARAFRLASALRTELGVQPGDRVAVLAANSRAFMELYHAAFLGACVLNPLNLRFAAMELEFVLRDSGTRVVFVDYLFARVIDQVRDAAGVHKVVLIGEPLGDPPHDLRYEDLITAGTEAEPSEPEEHDPCLLMYTGGTTGMPKGVLTDQRAQILNAHHMRMGVMTLQPDDVLLLQTPLFHAASMWFLIAPHLVGAPVHILPAFDPGKALDAMETHAVTFTLAVPTMLGMLLAHPEFARDRCASLRKLAYGASPMPEALLHKIRALFPDLDLAQGYGMTEAGCIITLLSPEDHRHGGTLLRSAGRAVPGVRLSIQDPDGRSLGPGEVGEVCAQGGNYMTGYWNRPEDTEEAFRGGWYHSGDAGHLDKAGYLFLVDRIKDVIVTGGENVYSAEVEHAISTHPAVAQVAVIGIPDAVWGEAVHAVVVRNPGVAVTEVDIVEHARRSIAGYKVPKSVEFRAEPLPLSGAMKVLKRELRAPHWAEHTRSTA